MSKNEKTVDEVAKGKPGLFKSRLAVKTVEHAGVTFHLRALPSLVVTFIRGQATDAKGEGIGGVVRSLYPRYGIADIVGLTDEDGKPVEVVPVDSNPLSFGNDSKPLMCVPVDIINGLDHDILTMLFIDILGLTHLGDAEKTKLDFTTASENPGQATDGAE